MQLALAPTDETALRRLILLLERLGDRAAAVRAYEDFAWKLQGEYELEPSAETQALVERIRAEPGESQAAAPGHQNGLSRAAGDGNSKARTPVAGYSTGPRLGAADLLREFEFRSRGLLTEPTPVSLPSRARRPAAIVAGAVVMLLLLGLAGLYLRTQARDRTLRAPPPPAGEAAPGIAVLPFAVQDGALANWREGLVDLVSIDLSGVAGLRAVDSRTLLARWRERVEGADIPELATALEVAERAGARYAVVGSVIANGPDLLLTAGVHEVEGRRMLGTARSQGPADSIFTLVDRLTLEILRLILSGEARELPRIDLARVSTSSLPALKSYLEGEVLFRRSQFQSAAEAYARAVEADSNFALARYRLGLSRWWVGGHTDSAPIPSTPRWGHSPTGCRRTRRPSSVRVGSGSGTYGPRASCWKGRRAGIPTTRRPGTSSGSSTTTAVRRRWFRPRRRIERSPGRSSSIRPSPCPTSIASTMRSARGTRPAPPGCSARSAGLRRRVPSWPGIAW